MFGIKIHMTSTHALVITTGGSFAMHETDGPQLWGPIGLYLMRRRYRDMLRTWHSRAHTWGCGQQDHFGEMMDHVGAEVDRLGGNARGDRRTINAEVKAGKLNRSY